MATFTIRGKNIEVTPALRDYVEKKVGKVTKYFDNVGEITVLLTVSKDRHIVEVTVPVQGILLRGQEATMDMYTSIDLVIEKIERQIRKYKTKLEKRFREGSIRTEMMTPPAKPVEEDETEYEDSDYDYDYDYGYTDENLYAQGEDVTYGQDEYTEQTNNY